MTMADPGEVARSALRDRLPAGMSELTRLATMAPRLSISCRELRRVPPIVAAFRAACLEASRQQGFDERPFPSP